MAAYSPVFLKLDTLYHKIIGHLESFVIFSKQKVILIFFIKCNKYIVKGIINLLQKYFEMKKQQCKDGLEIYKRYLTRMQKIQDFFKVAENVSSNRFNTRTVR